VIRLPAAFITEVGSILSLGVGARVGWGTRGGGTFSLTLYSYFSKLDWSEGTLFKTRLTAYFILILLFAYYYLGIIWHIIILESTPFESTIHHFDPTPSREANKQNENATLVSWRQTMCSLRLQNITDDGIIIDHRLVMNNWWSISKSRLMYITCKHTCVAQGTLIYIHTFVCLPLFT
jgi:hypothetical protein